MEGKPPIGGEECLIYRGEAQQQTKRERGTPQKMISLELIRNERAETGERKEMNISRGGKQTRKKREEEKEKLFSFIPVGEKEYT